MKNLVSHLISSGLLCVEAKEAKRTESLKYYLMEKYSGNQAQKPVVDCNNNNILKSSKPLPTHPKNKDKSPCTF